MNELQHVPVAKSRSMGEFLHSPANDATRGLKHVPDVELVTRNGLADLDLKVLNITLLSCAIIEQSASSAVDNFDRVICSHHFP